MPELVTALNDVAFEVGVVVAYVFAFGGLVYGWDAWETQAFAPKLSTITVVLYAKAVFEMFPEYTGLIRADIGASASAVHGLFRLPKLLLASFILPAIAVVLVVNQVRAYRPKPKIPPLDLVWRANLYGIITCFAMDPFAPYIRRWAADLVPHG